MPVPRLLCPLCRQASQPLFVIDGIGVRECLSCTHRFADLPATPEHVATHYADDYFHGGGAGYANYLGEERLRVAQGRQYARRIAPYLPPGRMLDVGAAAGFLLQGFVESGWTGAGLEPNAAMAQAARTRCGLEVLATDLEHYAGPGDLQLVSMIQVIAHFVDPQAALQRAADLLAPGGCLLIETWNCRSWTARLFGRRWHEYSPPTVLHWFTPQTLRQAAERSGLTQVTRGRLTKWIDGAHAKSLLHHKLGDGPGGRFLKALTGGVIPDRASLPYPADDLFWCLFRKPGA